MDTPQKIQELLDNYEGKTTVKVTSIYNQYVKNQTRFAYVGFADYGDKLVISKVSPWIGCRGYMCEALFGVSGGGKFKLGGSNYDLHKSIDGHAACLFLQNTDAETLQQVNRLLNSLEEQTGWDKSFFRVLKYKPNSYETEIELYFWCGDKKWFSATTYLSLLLMLIRLVWKVQFKPEDTLATWVTKVVKKNYDYHGVRTSDTDTLNLLFRDHSNLIKILMEHQEFVTEDLTYKEDVPFCKQSAGQDAGIHDAIWWASKFIKSGRDFEDRATAEDLFDEARNSATCTRINASLVLRYAVAIKEYGNNHKILEPQVKQTIF